MNRRGLLAFWVLLLPSTLLARNTPEVPRLSGIVNLPDFEYAAFEFAPKPYDRCRQAVVGEGQDLWGIKLLKVNPGQRAVEVEVDGLSAPLAMSLRPESNSVQEHPSQIALTNASLLSVLELYGDLSGHTLLYWPSLPEANFSLDGFASNRLQAASILEKALADTGIVIVADGDKFMMVLPKDKVATVKPGAPRGPAAPSAKSESVDTQAGEIVFHGAALTQVLDIYAKLVRVKLDRGSTHIPMSSNNSSIFFYNQSPLSREEAIYALETLIQWHGIKIARSPDNRIVATPAGE
jgi:hypothetical protein